MIKLFAIFISMCILEFVTDVCIYMKENIRGMINISIKYLRKRLIIITGMVCLVLCGILWDYLNVTQEYLYDFYYAQRFLKLGSCITVYYIIQETEQIISNLIRLEIPVPDLIKDFLSFLKDKNK